MTDHKPTGLERFSSLIALAALVGAVAVLVIGSFVNIGALVMMLVGLIVAIVGSWDLFTRRGAVRLVAAVLVIVGVGLLVGGFVWADLSVWRIVSVVVLALLSVVTARFALGKHVRDGGRRSAHSRVPPRPGIPS